MIKLCWAAMAALCSFVSPVWASADERARIEEERLLGSADGPAQATEHLPFTRQLKVMGTIDGPLGQSLTAAGLPAAAVLETVRAFGAALDLDEDLLNGDSFTVSYRQEYTLEGHPIGVAQVTWAALDTAARGTLSVHRFRAGRAKQERLWLANGEAAAPASLRWPLDEINVSSGFGLRSDPIAKPVPAPAAVAAAKPVVTTAKATTNKNRKAAPAPSTAAGGPVRPGPVVARRVLIMHQGVDFAAESGTPIHAAAAGTVTGARPNGGYGNWIEINHDDGLKTVYGHLSAFAPDLIEDAWVERGQLIGFVGTTGRSTGPHLHFELQHNGVPTNPIVHPAIRRPQMRGGDLARFRRIVARDLQEAP
ncbi:Peptidase family M23 [Rhodospirillales bacterium URHD0017]|nr:Peptidase family M23 [Rhodospirillales bacterium URHD0017]